MTDSAESDDNEDTANMTMLIKMMWFNMPFSCFCFSLFFLEQVWWRYHPESLLSVSGRKLGKEVKDGLVLFCFLQCEAWVCVEQTPHSQVGCFGGDMCWTRWSEYIQISLLLSSDFKICSTANSCYITRSAGMDIWRVISKSSGTCPCIVPMRCMRAGVN